MKRSITYFAYSIFGVLLFPFYVYRINPDAISYFEIAQNYLNGTQYVNGFWSPLLSWLLIPFLSLNIPPIVAFGIIQLIFGLFVLLAIHRIVPKLTTDNNRAEMISVASVPVLLYFVYAPLVSADLLSLTFLLFYIDTVLSKKVNGVYAGIYGALAYFAKTYSLFFVLVHFVVVMLYKKDYLSLRNGLLTLVCCILPWIIVLSVSYRNITVGNAGSYNFRTSRPGGDSKPYLSAGLIAPPPNATSYWYDPSVLPIRYTALPLQSQFMKWGSVITKNIVTMFYNYEGFTIFAFLILIYLLKNPSAYPNVVLLTAFIFSSAGYSIYHIEDRYIWFGAIMLLLMVSRLEVKKALLLVLLCSFIVIPVKRIISNINYRKNIHTFSTGIHVGGNIASNSEWNNSLYIAYFNRGKFYGIPTGTEGDILRSLRANDISYLLIWNSGTKYSFLSTMTPVQIMDSVTVYAL